MKKASSPRAYLAFPAVMSKFLEKDSWTLMLRTTLMWSENTTNKVGCAL